MIKNFSVLIIILASAFILTSCSKWLGIAGTGNLVSESITATDFQNIEVLNQANIQVIKGDTFLVQASDYQNLIRYLNVAVTNHTLVVSTSPSNTLLFNSKASVTITIPDSLKLIESAGSGNIVISSPFKDMNTLIMTGSGSIAIEGNLNLKALNAALIGSGNLTASGTVTTLTAVNSGSGNINFGSLNAGVSNCSVAGSGNIYTLATDSLKTDISGSGNVYYSGNPVILTNITGSGKVIQH